MKGICGEFVGELKQDIEAITSIQKGHSRLLFNSPESLLSKPLWRDMLLLPVYQEKKTNCGRGPLWYVVGVGRTLFMCVGGCIVSMIVH